MEVRHNPTNTWEEVGGFMYWAPLNNNHNQDRGTKSIRALQDKFERKVSYKLISTGELIEANQEYENLTPEQKLALRTEPGFRLVIDMAINRIKPYAGYFKKHTAIEDGLDYMSTVKYYYLLFMPAYMNGSIVTTDDFEIPKVDSPKTDLLINKLANKEAVSLSLFYNAKEEARNILNRMEELTENGIRDTTGLGTMMGLVNFFNDHKHKPLFMSVYPEMDYVKFGSKIPKFIYPGPKRNEGEPEPELQDAESRSVDTLTKKYHDQLRQLGRLLENSGKENEASQVGHNPANTRGKWGAFMYWIPRNGHTKSIRSIQDKFDRKVSSKLISLEEFIEARKEYENLSPEQKFGERTEPGFRLTIDLAINRMRPWEDYFKEHPEGIEQYIRVVKCFYFDFKPAYMNGSVLTNDDIKVPDVESPNTDLLVDKLANEEPTSLSLFYDAKEEARSIWVKMEELSENGIRRTADIGTMMMIVNYFNDYKHKPLFMSVYPEMDNRTFRESEMSDSEKIDILTEKYRDLMHELDSKLRDSGEGAEASENGNNPANTWGEVGAFMYWTPLNNNDNQNGDEHNHDKIATE